MLLTKCIHFDGHKPLTSILSIYFCSENAVCLLHMLHIQCPHWRHCVLSLCKTLYHMLCTGSNQEDLSRNYWKIVDWVVQNQKHIQCIQMHFMLLMDQGPYCLQYRLPKYASRWETDDICCEWQEKCLICIFCYINQCYWPKAYILMLSYNVIVMLIRNKL